MLHNQCPQWTWASHSPQPLVHSSWKSCVATVQSETYASLLMLLRLGEMWLLILIPHMHAWCQGAVCTNNLYARERRYKLLRMLDLYKCISVRSWNSLYDDDPSPWFLIACILQQLHMQGMNTYTCIMIIMDCERNHSVGSLMDRTPSQSEDW